MHKLSVRFGVALIVLAAVLALAAAPVGAQDDELVERGEYLAEIAGCMGCHSTPDLETMQPMPGMRGAGGYPFDLGPLGVVYTANITPDEETGIGEWTDEEIKEAITTGVSPDGLHQFPIMPYKFFNKMAEDDLDAIVAFLRTLPAVENEVPRQQILPVEALPAMPREDFPETAPDPSETAERGQYLFEAVLACTDCHTPLDAETQAPIQDMYFAGGQPYEGPWGIVYAANITPHEETGIGAWSDADIERIFRSGIRPDGRQVILMPWIDYQYFTDEDMAAVIHYLRNDVPPVDNEVPASDLNEDFIRIVEIPDEEPEATEASEAAASSRLPMVALVAGGAALLVVVALVVLMSRRNKSAG